MSRFNLSMNVNFYVGMGRVNAEDNNTFEELGYTEEDLLTMTDEEVMKDLQSMHDDFLGNHLDSGFYVEED